MYKRWEIKASRTAGYAQGFKFPLVFRAPSVSGRGFRLHKPQAEPFFSDLARPDIYTYNRSLAWRPATCKYFLANDELPFRWLCRRCFNPSLPRKVRPTWTTIFLELKIIYTPWSVGTLRVPPGGGKLIAGADNNFS